MTVWRPLLDAQPEGCRPARSTRPGRTRPGSLCFAPARTTAARSVSRLVTTRDEFLPRRPCGFRSRASAPRADHLPVAGLPPRPQAQRFCLLIDFVLPRPGSSASRGFSSSSFLFKLRTLGEIREMPVKLPVLSDSGPEPESQTKA